MWNQSLRKCQRLILYNSDLFHVGLSKASKAISLLSSGSFSWSTPVRGHARVDILGVGVGGWGGMLTFIATATTQYVLLHFHTYVMLRARTACYADGCKAWKRASKQQVPEKRLKWQNFAHNRGEFVKHLGGSPRKRVLLWPEHRL